MFASLSQTYESQDLQEEQWGILNGWCVSMHPQQQNNALDHEIHPILKLWWKVFADQVNVTLR